MNTENLGREAERREKSWQHQGAEVEMGILQLAEYITKT